MARADRPLGSVDDVWRRARIPISEPVYLAETGAIQLLLRLERRATLSALKALHDKPLSLSVAAFSKADQAIDERLEPQVTLRKKSARGKVLEDFLNVGLTPCDDL